jgi:hypothetical protein
LPDLPTLQNPGPGPEADALTSEGFVSGISQHYFARTRKAHGDHGIAKTVQLGSPEQAQAELNRDLARGPGKRFTVPAIPGSQGLRGGADRGGVVNHLGFTDGDYSFVIARLDMPGSAGDTKRRLASRGTKQVTKIAINLYNRVHGAAVCS